MNSRSMSSTRSLAPSSRRLLEPARAPECDDFLPRSLGARPGGSSASGRRLARARARPRPAPSRSPAQSRGRSPRDRAPALRCGARSRTPARGGARRAPPCRGSTSRGSWRAPPHLGAAWWPRRWRSPPPPPRPPRRRLPRRPRLRDWASRPRSGRPRPRARRQPRRRRPHQRARRVDRRRLWNPLLPAGSSGHPDLVGQTVSFAGSSAGDRTGRLRREPACQTCPACPTCMASRPRAGPAARAAFALRPFSAGRVFRVDLAFAVLTSIVVISIEPPSRLRTRQTSSEIYEPRQRNIPGL